MTLIETLQLAASWYLVVSLFGIALYPVLYIVCSRLPDRGISLYRSVGIAATVLPVWVFGNLVGAQFTTLTVVISSLSVGAIAWFAAIKWHPDCISFLRDNRRTVLAFEIATLGLFVVFVLFRGFNPDIVNTEKPMELAFLNAAITGGEIPVQDPWFAGESINYYYFGYVALAAVALVAGVPGEIAFNLGLATVFATATVAAGGLAANLTTLIGGFDRWRAATAALIAGYFVAGAGNLHVARQLAQDPSATLDASWWAGIGWSSSRIIEDGGFPGGGTRTVITEFPSFSWVLGDLHPHVLGYPLLFVALALTVNLHLVVHSEAKKHESLLAATALGIILGTVFSTNTWDVPIVLALIVGILVPTALSRTWGRLVTVVSSLIVGGLVTAGPFLRNYDSPAGLVSVDAPDRLSAIPGIGGLVNSVGYVAWDRSSFLELSTHWGVFLLFLVPIAGWLAFESRNRLLQWIMPFGLVGAGLTIGAMVFQAPALILFGIPACVLVPLTLSDQENVARRIAAGMVAIGLLTLCGIEFFFIQDPFGDRMNTVFKLSYQVWALFAVSIGALAPYALMRIRTHDHAAWLQASVAILGTALVLSSLYAPLSLFRWTGGFSDWRGIDGLSYMERSQPDERAAIDWLRDSHEQIDVVLEAPGCAYGSDNFLPHSRVSMATGIPAVIGWEGHQFQWRRGQGDLLDDVGHRIDGVNQSYENPSGAGEFLSAYNVTHVYVGTHERQGYRQCEHGPPYDVPDNNELEELGWERVFEQGIVRIYRLPATEPGAN